MWRKIWAWVRRLMASTVELFNFAARSYREDECMRSSAAVSYFALLSFLPFLVMTLSALGFVLFFVGSGYASQQEFLDQILQTTGHAIPFINENLAARFREIIQAREAMGIVGAVALVFTSSLVFSALEDALGRIFGVPRSRNVVASKLLFVGFVASIGVFIVISHYVFVFVDSFVAAAGGQRLMSHLYSREITVELVAYIGTILAFIALISYFCPKRIWLPYLLGGATLFYLLFEVAKSAFSLYLEYVAEFSTIYGSLSTFMVLIIWTFYTVIIFLFCAVVVKILDQYGFWSHDEDHEEEEIVLKAEMVPVEEPTEASPLDYGPGG